MTLMPDANYYLLNSSALEELREWPEDSWDCCVTSPPYWRLRDYEVEGQIGLERTPEEYVGRLVEVFREVRRTLSDEGTLWIVIGDSYCSQGGPEPAQTKWQVDGASNGQNGGKSRTVAPGLKAKDLVGVPWMLAFALRDAGWYLRSDIVWSKPNPMPESVTDRCTRSHEYLFLLSKSASYYYDSASIAESCVSTDVRKFTDGGANKQRGHTRRHAGFNGRYAATLEANGVPKTRNKRDVWTVANQGYAGTHFAVFPPALIRPCILAGCPVGGTVLDPFCRSGTTLQVARELGRHSVGIELNEEYCELVEKRMNPVAMTVRRR